MESDKSKNKYRIMSFIVPIIISLVVIYLHLLSHDKTQKIYLEQTEKTIIDLKKDFLKDTVNNVFLEIDRLRETKYTNYQNNTNSKLKRFQDELKLTDEAFIEFFIGNFNDQSTPKMWTAYLWDSVTGETLYITPDTEVHELEKILSSYAEIEKNNIKGIFGVSQAYIDDLVKKEMESLIKSRKFSGDSYIWINEILNYEGGDNYAFRRVHQNPMDTEGEYLSTDMEDIEGNLPYLEELEGIKKDGELFFNYYFKKLNSEDITEKISYAKLYKDYDWVIAMGVHLDDIDQHAETITGEINSLSSEAIIRLLRYIFVVLLIGFIALYFIDKDRLSTSTKSLEKEINRDALTKAYSRKFGERSLNTAFRHYKKTDENAAIMMFDLDGFKHVNDYYGHDVGDQVLIEVVRVVNDFIRSSDHFIRWGGDEFLGVFPGLKGDNVLAYGNKISSSISAIEIPVGEAIITITASIGFSCFKGEDIDSSQVLKRADDAMYRSKQEGKNKVTID